MFNESHTRYLAKQTAMHMLSKLAGFTPKDHQLVLAGDAIERDVGRRRSMLQQLVEHKYLETQALGQTLYVVTGRALDETGVETYTGELNIGTPAKPLATWLSAEMMKQAIDDLLSGDAKICDASRGSGKVVLSTFDARSDSEVSFDRNLAANLAEFADELTGMSTSFAECLRVPPNSLTATNIGAELATLYKDQKKEIQRLQRTNDAITVFVKHVEEDLGGWVEFIKLIKDGTGA